MGILDSLFETAFGSAVEALGEAQPGNPALQAVLRLLQGNGGVGGLVARLRESGLGAEADSWVATGPNHPVTPEALRRALGAGTVDEVAARLGGRPETAAAELARVLPLVVDRLTPNGVINHRSDPVGDALAELKRRSAGTP